MNIFQAAPKPFFVLAPMDDVTDAVFRQVVESCASPDIYFTEFVNVDGLQSDGRRSVMRKLRLGSNEKSVIAQIWGLKPENFYETAKQLANGEFGPYQGIDLNMGCPEKTVVKNGACAGLMHNPTLALEIIQATKEGSGSILPVSVKTRLGFNDIDHAWPELLLKQGLDALTIHGRTRKEMSKVPAHWDEIGHVRKIRDQLQVPTLIIGNGDVANRQDGLRLAETHSLDGIMIGRGVFQDPFIFAERSPWEQYSERKKIALYERQVRLFADTWAPGERSVHTLNKFCKVYINGFDGAKDLRETLMNAGSTDELLDILRHSTD
jgi:tRNA-dihydrouridine synthase